jgi:hypothetical protein
MNMASKLGARRAGLASRIGLGAALLVALAMALPAGASADQNCIGSVTKAAATGDDAFPMDYKVLCYEPIKGFLLGSTAEVEGFNVSADVFDPTGANLDPTDRFGECEGELPGNGFGCAGTYAATNKLIKGQFTLSADPCAASPRPSFYFVAEANTTAGKLSGPFDLGRPRGCPKASKNTKKATKKHKHRK